MTGARRPRVERRVRFAAIVSLVGFASPGLLPATAAAQNEEHSATWDVDTVIQQETYATPPPEIVDAVLAPRHLNVSLSALSPDKRAFLNEIGDGPVTMDVFSKPFHELGGLFIDFEANRARTLTISNNIGIQMISAADGSTIEVEVPSDARVSDASWSPDGKTVAYLAHFPDATHIWVADAETGRSRQLTRTPLLATLVTSFDWVGDGSRIGAVLIPDGREPMPVGPDMPLGPQVKVAEESDKNRLRTYRSLMATPNDQALLEWHTTGQVALIEVESRDVTNIGEPAIVRAIDFSPDGAYVRVTRMVEPFSYVVPVGNFGSVEELWDASGDVVATLDEEPINLGVRDDNPPQAPGVGGDDDDGDEQGPRELAWRADGQGLTYLEQEPAPRAEAGDSAAAGDTAAAAADSVGAGEPEEGEEEGGRARRKDRVMQWPAPFDSSSLRVIYEQDSRMSNHGFSPDGQVLFLSERDGRNTHEFAVYLNDTSQKHTLARYRRDDVYASPGSLVTTRGVPAGGRGSGRGGDAAAGADEARTVQLSSDGEHVFYQGAEYDEAPLEVGPKTFIDRVAIRTGDKQRVFESDNDGVFEEVDAILDADATRLVISRESPTEVPQSYVRENGSDTQLTHNEDYTPDITGAPEESFTVERPDGFKFRVNVRMPLSHRPGERVPAMFWFYPREYTDQEAYDRDARTFNKNAFPDFGTRSMAFLVRLGYAVVEPDAPIVGDSGQMNNNYEHDLRNNLATVIDELDRRGIIDRTRLGVGGHSYGAFSTANAMAHTPFFKAGIAGDGAFNRTLTPLGFQSERRNFWDARDVYLSMSPFMYANDITGALLLYHGLHDQNVGTDPINSPRLFHALNGLGKTVAMYLYPFEDHGPATKETLLDLWARWSAWLDKYVKNAKSPQTSITTEQATTEDGADRLH